jgi:hypothetical protein
LTRVLPAPQAAAISVIMPSGSGNGAGVKAWADVATNKAKPAIAINLIIIPLLFQTVQSPSLLLGKCGYRKLSNAGWFERLIWIKAALDPANLIAPSLG